MANKDSVSQDLCTHAIEAFVDYASRKGKMSPNVALSELLYFYLGHQHKNMLINTAWTKEEVSELRKLFLAKNETTRTNLLAALKDVCHKKGFYFDMELINDGTYTPASVLASFQEAALASSPDAPVYEVNLDTYSNRVNYKLQSLYDKQSILRFCLEQFSPKIVITGNVVENMVNLNSLKDILNTAELMKDGMIPTLCYSECDINRMGPSERPVFLNSLGKTRHLEIKHADMNRWTGDDWKHFIHAIKKSPELTTLCMNDCDLSKCCKDPSKFKYILELFSLSQLVQLNLHNNHLRKLPSELLDQLVEAKKNSTIPQINVTLDENKASPSNTGIFAPVPEQPAVVAKVEFAAEQVEPGLTV